MHIIPATEANLSDEAQELTRLGDNFRSYPWVPPDPYKARLAGKSTVYERGVASFWKTTPEVLTAMGAGIAS